MQSGPRDPYLAVRINEGLAELDRSSTMSDSSGTTQWFGTKPNRYGLDYIKPPLTEAEAIALIERYSAAAAALNAEVTQENCDAYSAVYRELLQALTR